MKALVKDYCSLQVVALRVQPRCFKHHSYYCSLMHCTIPVEQENLNRRVGQRELMKCKENFGEIGY